ncbi:hypothetical protein B0H13DRAFT_2371615 [Mycena leptocephala]|nr:hypothetical protein B0H13DRAFT_2371615 [Mycena leptocephala]
MLANLEADRARIADLEAQILHLERSLSALREEKIIAQERLDSYKYPVLTLPNEIVSDIFIHFLPAYPLCPPLTGLLSPTLLTHICRRWREIALGTPALWSTISTSYHDGIPLKQKAHILDLWLKSSRFRPLSLRINNEIGVAAILAAMHLRLTLSENPATDVLAFRDVPLLRSVILNGLSLNVILPWQTSNLVRCVLQFEGMYGDNDQPGPDITLPYLESLSIDQYGAIPVTDFLETFIVPALRRLEIPEECLGTSPLDSLTGFISKSGCKLEEVHITGPRSLPKQSYRKAFPSIHKFSFNNEDDLSDSDAPEVEDNFDSE